jgi:DNA-binding response OmpR family regulator
MEAVLADYFTVRACSSPRSALRLVEGESFDVVCLDFHLPEMDGIEFFGSLAHKLGARIPSCIFMTAHAAELMRRLSLESKLLGMLSKPFSPRELIERVTLFASLSRMKPQQGRLRAMTKGPA